MKNFNSCRLLLFSTKYTWSTHFPININFILINILCYVLCHNFILIHILRYILCYVKYQNILVYLLEHLSFWLRCPSFLLSKFASQLKFIQSMVRVGILEICVTSSILRVLLSGFWVSGSQFPSPRDPFPGSWVWGFRVPE